MRRTLTLAGEIIDAAGLVLIVAAVLLLAGCGVRTTEPDCDFHPAECLIADARNAGQGDDGDAGLVVEAVPGRGSLR